MSQPDLSKLRLSRAPDGELAVGRRGRVRRLLLPVVLIAAVAAAGLWGYQRFRNAPVEIEQATVTTAFPFQNHAVLTSTGYVVAQRKAAVASKATGRLEWLGVQEGSRVRKGDVIARLENTDVSAARDQTRASLQVARANLEQARVELAEARREAGRSLDLLRQKFVSEAVHDQAVARVDKAAAAVRSLQASISVAQANVRAADVSVEQTLIRAPFDGVVLTKSANVGDVVTPFSSALDAKGAVVTMADMATLEVEADVSESNLSKVRVDQPVEIHLDALPERRFGGTVSRMVPTVDRAKATVMTKIRFEALDAAVLPEMSAKVTFLSQPVTDADRQARTAVNPAAVVKRPEGEAVFVVKEGVVRATPIRLGGKLGDLVEIVSGLNPGDKVVLRPGPKILDGVRVKVAGK